MQIYDLIIIGAGPAGITASVYASRKKLNFLVISKDFGGQAAWSGDIENYTGYQFITGPELAQKFQEHLSQYNIVLKENEEVLELRKIDKIIRIKTDKTEYQARTVIIASGKKSRELDVPGEKEFKNRGLTYCVICDGPLFSGKVVAVIGGGNSALDAVLQLQKIAEKIYLINNTSKLAGDAVLREKVKAENKVEIFNNSHVVEIVGDKFVKSIKIKHNQDKKELAVQGVFVEVGLIPNTNFAKDIIKNKDQEIKIDIYNQTNVLGIFAAGDATDVIEKQIIIAAGEGAKACLSASRYLARNNF